MIDGSDDEPHAADDLSAIYLPPISEPLRSVSDLMLSSGALELMETDSGASSLIWMRHRFVGSNRSRLLAYDDVMP